jgi:hypothetical protein
MQMWRSQCAVVCLHLRLASLLDVVTKVADVQILPFEGTFGELEGLAEVFLGEVLRRIMHNWLFDHLLHGFLGIGHVLDLSLEIILVLLQAHNINIKGRFVLLKIIMLNVDLDIWLPRSIKLYWFTVTWLRLRQKQFSICHALGGEGCELIVVLNADLLWPGSHHVLLRDLFLPVAVRWRLYLRHVTSGVHGQGLNDKRRTQVIEVAGHGVLTWDEGLSLVSNGVKDAFNLLQGGFTLFRLSLCISDHLSGVTLFLETHTFVKLELLDVGYLLRRPNIVLLAVGLF